MTRDISNKGRWHPLVWWKPYGIWSVYHRISAWDVCWISLAAIVVNSLFWHETRSSKLRLSLSGSFYKHFQKGVLACPGDGSPNLSPYCRFRCEVTRGILGTSTDTVQLTSGCQLEQCSSSNNQSITESESI